MSNIGVNVGSDVLKLPGTNGQRFFEGGMPLFSISSYTGYGTTDSAMPYYRDNDQIQYVLNATWNKGSHSVRFGSDVLPGHQQRPARTAEPSAVFHGGFGVPELDRRRSGRSVGQQLQFLGDVPARLADQDRARPSGRRQSLHRPKLAIQLTSAINGRWARRSRCRLAHGGAFPIPAARTGASSATNLNTNMINQRRQVRPA